MLKRLVLTTALTAMALTLILPIGDADAQSQGVTRSGSISGSIGEMSYEGGVPVPNPPNRDIIGGAYYDAALEGRDVALTVRVLAVGSGESIRRTPHGYYGNNAVRLEFVFNLPEGTTPEQLNGDMLEWSTASFVEVWGTNVIAPSLQYSTKYAPPSVSFETLELTDDGLAMSGRVTGEACLYSYDVDMRGDRSATQPRIMGETLCPRIDLEFSAVAVETHR